MTRGQARNSVEAFVYFCNLQLKVPKRIYSKINLEMLLHLKWPCRKYSSTQIRQKAKNRWFFSKCFQYSSSRMFLLTYLVREQNLEMLSHLKSVVHICSLTQEFFYYVFIPGALEFNKIVFYLRDIYCWILYIYITKKCRTHMQFDTIVLLLCVYTWCLRVCNTYTTDRQVWSTTYKKGYLTVGWIILYFLLLHLTLAFS